MCMQGSNIAVVPRKMVEDDICVVHWEDQREVIFYPKKGMLPSPELLESPEGQSDAALGPVAHKAVAEENALPGAIERVGSGNDSYESESDSYLAQFHDIYICEGHSFPVGIMHGIGDGEDERAELY